MGRKFFRNGAGGIGHLPERALAPKTEKNLPFLSGRNISGPQPSFCFLWN